MSWFLVSVPNMCFLSDTSRLPSQGYGCRISGDHSDRDACKAHNGELKARIDARESVNPGETIVGLEFRSPTVTLFEQSTGSGAKINSER